MLELEKLPRVSMATFDRDTKYNEVTVLKQVDAALEDCELFENFDSIIIIIFIEEPFSRTWFSKSTTEIKIKTDIYIYIRGLKI